MYYKKREEYSFSMPREHYAYLAFKERLKDMGIRFVEEGGHTEAVIAITNRGHFEVDCQCDILNLVREEN